MPSPYTRTIDQATGKIYINPNTGKNSELYPMGGLTSTGIWVPIALNPDGTLVQEGSSTSINPHFDDVQEDTTPGLVQTLVDNTVPVGVTRYIGSVILKTRVTGYFEILANGELIGSGRTGPGGDLGMNYTPMRPLIAGTEYLVTFKSRANSPVQSVECYVQANDLTM